MLPLPFIRSSPPPPSSITGVSTLIHTSVISLSLCPPPSASSPSLTLPLIQITTLLCRPPPYRYVISVARKLGCSVFLVWEDLLQVRGGGGGGGKLGCSVFLVWEELLQVRGGGALGRTEGEWYGRREEVTPAG